MKPNTESTFWSRVDRRGPCECWEWQSGKHSDGYGWFHMGGKSDTAHRWAYRFVNGDIPAGSVVRHTCDNRRCCNPSHLLAGSVADNNHDCRDRRRHVAPSGCRNGRSKLEQHQVKAIIDDPRSSYEVARELGVNASTVQRVRRGERYTAEAAHRLANGPHEHDGRAGEPKA